jgi:hypothetical protein
MATKATRRPERSTAPWPAIRAAIVADRESWLDTLPQPQRAEPGATGARRVYVDGYNAALRDVRDALLARVRR